MTVSFTMAEKEKSETMFYFVSTCFDADYFSIHIIELVF
jgi:hypothetical protein